jgi:hypothetical protein
MPEYDCVYFIAQSLPTSFRREHELELMNIYYDTMMVSRVLVAPSRSHLLFCIFPYVVLECGCRLRTFAHAHGWVRCAWLGAMVLCQIVE